MNVRHQVARTTDEAIGFDLRDVARILSPKIRRSNDCPNELRQHRTRASRAHRVDVRLGLEKERPEHMAAAPIYR
jgi:hypothetical protein